MNRRNAYLFFVLLLIIGNATLFAQQSKTDSLKRLLTSAISDTTKIRLRYEIGETGRIFRISYWDSLAKDAQAVGHEKYYALALNNIGYIEDNQGHTLDAFDKYYTSIEIQRRIGDKKDLASSLSNLGIVYKRQGMMLKALECYFESLKIREQINDKQGIAYSLSNIAVIYASQGEKEKGLEYDIKALKIREEIGDKEGISQSLSNLGVDYIYTNPDKALNYFLQSLKIRKEIGGARWEAATLNNIGFVFFTQAGKEKDENIKRELIEKALHYYNQSLTISINMEDKNGLSYSYYYIGSSYMLIKNYVKAQEFNKLALQNALETQNLELIKNIYDRMYKTYKLQNKIAQALEMHEQFKLMADSINNRDNKNSAVKKQMQYDFDKKEAAEKLKQEKRDNEAKAAKEKQRIILIVVSVVLVLVAIFAVFIFRSLRTTQKQNLIIEQQKQTVEAQKELVEAQKELVEEKQKEILDSIHYAKRIQESLLPTAKYIERKLKELKK